MPKKTPRRNTRAIILASALKLFNRDGIVNVRLQHIADEAFASVGNLAYHFPNKESIVLEIYEEFAKLQKQQLAELGIVPLFDYLDQQFSHTYDLQQRYIFFFLDTLEIIRGFPEIAEAHQQHINWTLPQLELMIDFNIARGAFRADITHINQQSLAQQVWMTTDSWLAQQHIRGHTTPSKESFMIAIWSLLYPYFTQMGQMEFTQLQEMKGKA